MPRRIIALVCLCTFALSGCYSYRFADQGEAVAGTDVRLRITPEEAGRLMETVRVEARTIEGSVTEGSGDNGLMIETPVLNSSPRVYQRLHIPQQEIVDVEVKEFNTGKTVLLGAVIAAGVAAIGFTAIASDKNNSEDNRPPPIDQIRIPLFSFGTR
jgi:hypothetical protein